MSAPVLKVRTSGLKGHDVNVPLGKRTLLAGPNGSGKSTVAEAIRIAFLGLVPALGRRLPATAALMRGDSLAVEVKIGDRSIQRRISRTQSGGVEGHAWCSWVGEGGDASAEALALVGSEWEEVAEALDIRELLNATPNKRAAKLQALFGGEAEIGPAIERETYRRLSGVTEDRMPAEGWRAALEILVPKRQRPTLIDAIETMRMKLADIGVAKAIDWANMEKRLARASVKDKSAASAELHRRKASVGEPDAEALAEEEKNARAIERNLGVLSEQIRAREALVTKLDRARAAMTEAEAKRDAARDALRATTPAEDIAALQLKIEQIQEAIDRSPVLVESPEQIAAQEAFDRLADQMIALGTAGPRPNIEGAEDELLALADNPWGRVIEAVDHIDQVARRAKKLHAEIAPDIAAIFEAARAHAPADYAAQVQATQEKVATVQAAYDEWVEASRLMKEEGDRIRAERQQAREDVERERAALAKAQKERTEAIDLSRNMRVLLEEEIASVTRAADQAAHAYTKAADAFTAAVGVYRELATENEAAEELVGDPAAQAEGMRGTAAAIKQRMDALRVAITVHQEFNALIEEIERLEARAEVFGALEEAMKTSRNLALSQQGGDLRAIVAAVLDGAGRPFAPYVRAEANSCQIGWTTSAGDVSIEALCAGEWVIYAAALTAAVLILRGAPVRILLVEAGECDAETLRDLMSGLAEVDDQLTASVVMSQTAIEAPEGWDVVDMREKRRKAA